MMAMIDSFIFEMDKVSFQNLKEHYVFGWSEKQRLYNNPIYMKKHKSSHAVELGGTLVLKKTYVPDPLIDVAEQKKPVTFVTHDGAKVLRVVILELNIDRDILLKTGSEIRKKFNMKMKEYYGN